MLHGNLIARDESPIAITDQVSGAPGGDFIVVPDTQLLFHAEFKRVGNDLKLVGEDGKTFLVADYFKHEHRLKLVSKEGAGLSGDIVEALAGPANPGQYAQATAPAPAGELVGKVVSVSGSAQIVRNGVAITLNTGDAVLKGDVVQTGTGGAVSIIFTDSTTFNLSSDARMVINEFVYDPNGSANSTLISLVQGTIGFVAGQVAKTGDMKVKTPVATMGIRGTAVVVDISASDGVTSFSVVFEKLTGTNGAFELRDNLTGNLLGTVSNTNVGWVVRPLSATEVFAQQLTKSVEQIQKELAIIDLVFQNQSFGQQLLNLTDPNNTKAASIGTQFIVSDRLGINPGDPLGRPTTYTVGTGAPADLPKTNSDGTPYINHPPVAVADGQTHNDFAQVTESGVGPGNNANAGTPAVSGNLLTNDSDPDGDQITVMSVTPVSARLHAVSLSVNSNGTYTYTLDNSDPEVEALALGETITDVYRYTIQDTSGATATAELTVTIVGTNDRPFVDVAHTTANGTIHEIPVSDGTIYPDDTYTDPHPASGTIAFNDVDLSDTHTLNSPLPVFQWSVGPLSPTLISALSAASTFHVALTDSTGTGAGTIGWDYAITDAALDFLAEGETLTVTYPVVLTDNNGASFLQNVTITITGSNDTPVIDVANTTAIGAFSETTDGVVPPAGGHEASGTIAFKDVDLTDPHTLYNPAIPVFQWSAGALNTTQANALAAASNFDLVLSDSTGTGAGTVGWTYHVSDSALDFLADGETLTATYAFSIDDPYLGSVTQFVTVTITGSNDTPVITVFDIDGAVTEDDAASLTENGSVTFADLDATDHETAAIGFVSATASPGATVSADLNTALQNALTLGAYSYNSSTGTVNWNFALDNALAQYLADGETVTATYTIIVTDDSGTGSNTSAPQTVTVVITGTNDTPVITAVDVDGAVTEDDAGSLTETGSITFADLDATDHETAAIGFVSATASSGASVSADLSTALQDALTLGAYSYNSSTGTVNWDFALDNDLVQYLADGETVTVKYTITVTDDSLTGSAASVPQTVTVIIAGTNDTPVIATTSDAQNETESGVSASGTITFTDVDLTDRPEVTTAYDSYEYTDGSAALSLTPPQLSALTGDLALTVGANTNNGSVDWSYQVGDVAVDFLAAGQTLTLTYIATVDDGNGGTADQPFTVAIHGTNDAPVAEASSAALTAINEDPATNDGQTIADLVGGNFSDVDSGATLAGVAVSGNAADAATQGSWQFWCDGAGEWLDIGEVSIADALALSADTLIRFVPVADYNGTPPALTVYGLDDTYSGEFTYVEEGGDELDRHTINVATRGGETPISADSVSVGITVNSVNDAPDSSDAGTTILEDTTYIFAVSDFGFDDSHDVPANTHISVTISTLPGIGTLTLDGVDIGTVPVSIGLDDIADGKLVYDPGLNNNGTADFTFQVQDDGGTDLGGADLDPEPNTFTIDITPVNDAPELFPRGSSLPTLTEDQPTNGGQTVASMLNAGATSMSGPHITDVDSGALTGIAITGTTTENGHWEYSIDAGSSWISFDDNYSDSSALLLDGADKIRFVPDGMNGGHDMLSYRAWDQTAGAHGDTIQIIDMGGTSAFSAIADAAYLAVTPINDAPVLDLDSSNPPDVATGYSSLLLNDGNSFPIAVAPSVSDVDNTTMHGATFVLTDGEAGDFFFVPLGSGNSGQLGSGIDWAITGIAGDSGDPLTVTFSGDFSSSDYADAIQQVSFGTTSSVIGDRHIAVSVNDGTDNSNEATATITVQPDEGGYNHAPVFNTDGATPTPDGDGHTTLSGLAVSDVDGDSLTVTFVADSGSTITLVDPAAIDTDSGPGVSFTDTLQHVNDALDLGIVYSADTNPPANDTITMTVNDGHGGTDTVNFIFNQGEDSSDLTGTAGKDVIFSSGGSGDTLHAGAGNDTLVFGQEDFQHIGNKTIDDFHAGDLNDAGVEMDKIALFNSPYADFDALSAPAVMHQIGPDTFIDFGPGNSITLAGVNMTALHASNFIIHPALIG